MGYLKLVILVFGICADIACVCANLFAPAGCAPEANRCVTTGPLWTRFSKARSGRLRWPYARAPKKSAMLRPPATHSALLTWPPRQISPAVPIDGSDQKHRSTRRTNQCVKALTGSAQLWGCFFEDDAGRAEDKRNWPELP